MKYHIAKGVFDILPFDPSPAGVWRESGLWQYLEKMIHETAKEFGFREIRTPVFEQTELFERSIGSGTDIVNKEMYTFFDKANRSLTLRPEGTAPVMRSLIENQLLAARSHLKLYYLFPMFRYERRQAGRYRQHHQFGVEAVGTDSPYQDVEIIDLLFTLLTRLGLKGFNLQLNTIGGESAREAYRAALRAYLKPKFDSLSPESQERFGSNVLRILDSKDPKDREALSKAPAILDFLDKEDEAHFETICSLLKEREIPYTLNPYLVRGLDYYNRTVFEVIAEELGTQNALGGGGRYDKLIQELGGPDTPAVGFGVGIERILHTCLNQKVFLPPSAHLLLYLVPLGDEARKYCFYLLSSLRRQHLAVDMDLTCKKLGKAMKAADQSQARYVAVIGDDELKTQKISLKEMATGKTQSLSIQMLAETLKHV